MNKALGIGLGVVALIGVAGASFYAGTVVGKEQTEDSVAARGPGAFQGASPDDALPQARQGARAGGQAGMLFGEIARVGEGLLIVTDQDDQQTEVHVTDTTLIEKNASVDLADLAEGETVIVSGSEDDDGSITARSIQVAPAGRLGFGGPGPGSAPDAP